MDWGEIVDGNLEYYVIPGTHDSITGNNNIKIEDANMKALADQLRTFLI